MTGRVAQPNAAEIEMFGGNFGQGGTIAQRLLKSGFQVNSLRTLDVLQKDEWIHFDNTVVEVARQRLNGTQDLLSRGLSLPLTNALGTTIVQWEKVSDMTPAQVSMSGVTADDNDRVTYDLDSLPIPIIHKGFNINIRALEASRRRGESLDTTQAALASRIVSDKIESILFLGSTVKVGGFSIYGYTTAPNRNTGSLSGNWATVNNGTVTGTMIVNDVLSMIQASYDQHMYGPFVLYVPLDYYVAMSEDFKAESDRTILERVKAIPGITDIKPAEQLTGGASGKVVLAQLTRDVVDMVNGMSPTVVQWESHGGFVMHFKVFAIMVPRFKSDEQSQSGITVFAV
jgi:uncharacterized linocin/CFP29 family protein